MLLFIINWILGYCLLIVITLLIKAFQIGTAKNRNNNTPAPNFSSKTSMWEGKTFWVLFFVSPLLGAIRLQFTCCYKKYYEPLSEDTSQNPGQQNITSQTNLSAMRNNYAMDDSKQAVDGNDYELDPKSVGKIEPWLKPDTRGSNSNFKVNLQMGNNSSKEMHSASFGLGDEFGTIDQGLDSMNKTIEDKMKERSAENTTKFPTGDDSSNSDKNNNHLDSSEPKIPVFSSPSITKEDESRNTSHRSGNADQDLGSGTEQQQEDIKLKWEKKKQEMIEERRQDRANERKRQREQRKAKQLPRKGAKKDADSEITSKKSEDEESKSEFQENESGLQGDGPI